MLGFHCLKIELIIFDLLSRPLEKFCFPLIFVDVLFYELMSLFIYLCICLYRSWLLLTVVA